MSTNKVSRISESEYNEDYFEEESSSSEIEYIELDVDPSHCEQAPHDDSLRIVVKQEVKRENNENSALNHEVDHEEDQNLTPDDFQLPTTSSMQFMEEEEEDDDDDDGDNPIALPATNSWPGHYCFNASVIDSNNPKNYCYSELTKKLYVNIGSPCVITFSTNGNLPKYCQLKASLEYVEPEHVEDSVERCAYHSSQSESSASEDDNSNHVLRCESSAAVYSIQNHRNYVAVPYTVPEGGNTHTRYLYKFMCLSSCVGGINRRAIQIVFSLENYGKSLGRQCLEVKICKCPQRDMRKDEERLTNPVVKNNFNVSRNMEKNLAITVNSAIEYNFVTQVLKEFRQACELQRISEACIMQPRKVYASDIHFPQRIPGLNRKHGKLCKVCSKEKKVVQLQKGEN